MSSLFIIAEAGVNHNGSLDRAFELVRIAKECGADAVKFQTFRAEDLVTADAPAAAYQTRNAGVTRQFDMLKKLELPAEWHVELKKYSDELGIEFFSTPFSESAVDLLVRTGVRRLKLSSGELTNKPLLQHAARTGLPLILSTGMGTLEEVCRAVEWIDAVRPATAAEGVPPGEAPLCVLHCTSNYPASPDALNLRAIETLARALSLPVGYSDHSEGATAALLAIALGASMIEKHITFDTRAEGPDHLASMPAAEFKAYVRALRDAELMLGSGEKAPHVSELDTLAVARRSVVSARALPSGHALRREDMILRRPAGGIEPAHIDELVGRKLVGPLKQGQVVAWEHLSVAE